jgi:glycosyltransferase involved in cell wall biosynthesis
MLKYLKKVKQSDLDIIRCKQLPLKVVFAPWYSKQNPYQTKLSEHLSKLDVHVEGVRCSTLELGKSVLSSEAKVLHLHWLHHFFLLEKNAFRSLTKLIIFIVQLLILRAKGIKLVWTVHNFNNHSDKYLWIDFLGSCLVAHISHCLIFHSETARNEIVHKFWLSRKKHIEITPHASYVGDYQNLISREESRKTLNLSESSLVILFFGSIFSYKGVLELTQTFIGLGHPKTSLVIAGRVMDSDLGKRLEEIIADHTNIRYHPEFVPDEKVQIYMNACDVVAFPYKQSLTSGAVNLAMSFGKACLVPKSGYLAEILDEGGAFFYDPAKADGLLNAIEIAIKNQANIADMGKHNYLRASQLSWQSMASLTLKAYR